MIDYGLVSIITPSFNCSKFVEKTIKSVLRQTYTNWELIITDDCSTDNSVEIIQRFVDMDSRIRLLKLKKNSGAGVARNKSIENAKGKYIAFLDSDDLWMPYKLEKQINFMRANDYLFSHSYTLSVDENNNVVGLNKKPRRVSFESTRLVNFIGTSSVVYDAEALGKFYMIKIRKRQDMALWLSILKKSKYAYCFPEPLFCYRYTSGSVSSNKMSLYKYHLYVYQEALGYSKIRSAIVFYLLSLPCLLFKKIEEKLRERFIKPDLTNYQNLLNVIFK